MCVMQTCTVAHLYICVCVCVRACTPGTKLWFRSVFLATTAIGTFWVMWKMSSFRFIYQPVPYTHTRKYWMRIGAVCVPTAREMEKKKRIYIVCVCVSSTFSLSTVLHSWSPFQPRERQEYVFAAAKIRSTLLQLTIWSCCCARGQNPISFSLRRRNAKEEKQNHFLINDLFFAYPSSCSI